MKNFIYYLGLILLLVIMVPFFLIILFIDYIVLAAIYIALCNIIGWTFSWAVLFLLMVVYTVIKVAFR